MLGIESDILLVSTFTEDAVNQWQELSCGKLGSINLTRKNLKFVATFLNFVNFNLVPDVVYDLMQDKVNDILVKFDELFENVRKVCHLYRKILICLISICCNNSTGSHSFASTKFGMI